ncbi:hypothetical protein ABPG72_019197 [Tetrahymena utriculariae]
MGNSNNNKQNGYIGPYTLSIKALCWKQDSHQLFDFESKDIIKKKINIKKSGYLTRSQNNEINFSEYPSQENESFLQIGYHQQQYTLQNDSMESKDLQGISDRSIWTIISTFKDNDQEKGFYKLSADDYIKIGRVRLRIKEINPVGDFSQQEPEELLTYNSKNGTKPTEEIQCRICLGDTYIDDNPFIAPCACTGSVQYIHLICLKIWLQNKLVIKSNDYYTEYQWKKLECELCKQPLKPYIIHNGREFSTFTIRNPACPYIILEKLQKDTNEPKSQLIVNFSSRTNENKIKKEKTLLKIGRGALSHIRINDISVSREHAHLVLKNQQFYLKDQNSKFGTLVLVREPIDFSAHWNKVSIQIGQTVLQLKLKKVSSNFFSCNSQQPEQDPLEDQIQKKILNKTERGNSQNGFQQDNYRFEKGQTEQINDPFQVSTFHKINFNNTNKRI